MMNKPVIILEKSNAILESKSVGDSYVLEGVFAEFGVKNNNGRIYEEAEYRPHLKYLNEKIERRNLVGELDHPEKFDLSLKNASHIVENISYDKNSNTIRGKVRLLNTPMGRQAKDMINDGVKLSISSRAAGIVESNNTVRIKKIFTYDLVADPGFSLAGLNRINESCGIDDENLAVFELTDEFIEGIKDKGLKESLSEIMRISENLDNEYIKEETKTTKMDHRVYENENIVRKDELNKYSQLIHDTFKTMNEDIQALKKEVSKRPKKTQNISENVNASEIMDQLGKITSYLNYVSENFNKQEAKLNKSIKFQKKLSEGIDHSIGYTENISSKIEKDFGAVRDYLNYIGNETNKVIGYGNYLAENFDMSVQHQDYIATKLNELTNYSNYLAESQESIIEYNNYQTSKIDQAISHQDYLAENMNASIYHQDYLAENMNLAMNYMDYQTQSINNNINYTEYVAEKALPHLPKKDGKVDESLSGRIDRLIESVENQKTVTGNDQKGAIGMLSESNKARFDNLSFTDKQKVIDATRSGDFKNEGEVLAVWKSALGETQLEESLLAHMPKDVRPVWESLSENQKTVIRARSSYWDLSTPYKIKNFWNSQALVQTNEGLSAINETVQNSEFYQKLNESYKKNTVESSLGYSRDSISNVSRMLSNRKNS